MDNVEFTYKYSSMENNLWINSNFLIVIWTKLTTYCLYIYEFILYYIKYLLFLYNQKDLFKSMSHQVPGLKFKATFINNFLTKRVF